MPNASRQEVANVVLAELFQEYGLVSSPEQIIHTPGRTNRLPDVMANVFGLRVAVEAEYAQGRGDAGISGAEQLAFEAAVERVEEGIAHIGVAVVYPNALRRTPFVQLRDTLRTAELRFALVNETIVTMREQGELFAGEAQRRFFDGTVAELVASIKRSVDLLVQEDTVTGAVERIEVALAGFISSALHHQPAAATRLASVLEIGLPAPNVGVPAGGMDENQRAAILKVSALILVNALIFQEVLSRGDARVQTLQRMRGADSVTSAVQDHWRYILTHINYFPIFGIALPILEQMSAGAELDASTRALVEVALGVVAMQASLRHDLAGRIYHRILEEAKYLGAFYTSVPAATMLLKVAFSQVGERTRWSSLESIAALRVCDLACGTGTLLMAAADAILDKYVTACASEHVAPDTQRLDSELVLSVIYGYDVLNAAIHLTASTLSLRAPAAPINTTHLFRMPLGGSGNALGSLEFLDRQRAPGTLFSAPTVLTGQGPRSRPVERPPLLDVAAMNPPFTRSVGGNLLFGNLPDDERQRLQARLGNLMNSSERLGNVTAGLGAPFVSLADDLIRDGGVLALVLPKTLLSGPAWEETRRLIANKYSVSYVIVSHENGHWNFSENTKLSEVLLVATKRDEGVATSPALFVNLRRQPRNSVEALAYAEGILDCRRSSELAGTTRGVLTVRNEDVAEFVVAATTDVSSDLAWGRWAAFASSELVQQIDLVRSGSGSLQENGLQLTPLGRLGTLGMDRRDVHDAFTLSTNETAYPAIWRHDSRSMGSLAQTPNAWLKARTTPAHGRPLRSAAAVWDRAGRLLLAERLRLTTMRMLATLIPVPVLSNVWWTFTLNDATAQAIAKYEALTLWLNSSVGIALALLVRQETEGAWIALKKPTWSQMPVLNVDLLTPDQLASFHNRFQDIGRRSLSSFAAMAADGTRVLIDQAIAEILGYPDTHAIRAALAREPIMQLGSRRRTR